MNNEPDGNNSSVFEESDTTYNQMSEDIEDIIREMSEEEIARIRGGYEDPLFRKGNEIRYRDEKWVVVDYDVWYDGKPRYILRPRGEDWVESHGRELVDTFAREVDEQ